MPNCNTNCVEKPLAKGFEKLGRIVGIYPWVFFILPLIISAGLGAGFYFLKDREANDIEEQFTPQNGPAKAEREFIKEHFPQRDEFSSLRLYTEGAYASLIAEHPTNILNSHAFDELVNLDHKVKNITVNVSKLTFSDLCAKKNGECVLNPILNLMNDSINFNRPIHYPLNDREFTGTLIGGVHKYSNNTIQSAKAIRMFYYLKEDKKNETDLWLKKFIQTLSEDANLKTIDVSYFTSISRAEEFETNPQTVIPLFSITYFLAITVSIVSCMSHCIVFNLSVEHYLEFYLTEENTHYDLSNTYKSTMVISCQSGNECWLISYHRLDCVRNKVWVATFGVLSAGLAVLTSFGLLLLCGMPFVMTVASSPFLILGIGVDDMFIMVSCWQKTRVKAEVKDRMAETYKEAAVSITITTLTDVLAFYIGLMTPFGSVQSFCMYTGTAILFCYIYNITFFGAFLALNGQREGSNRHWLLCRKVETPSSDRKGNACSVGGAYDPETGAEEEMPINILFRKYYGPFLTKPWTKVFVILLYLGYLAGSIYGCLQMQEGIDLKNLAPDDSYVASYYDNEDKHFSEYGPFVMLVIKDGNFQYWEKSARENLNTCLNDFEKSKMVAKGMTISWLSSYISYGNNSRLNLTDEKGFMEHLPTYLQLSGLTQDVIICNDKIRTSRLFIPTVNISTAIDEKNMLNFFRNTSSTCGQNMDLMVYHPAFIFYDQYAVIVNNTVQNIVVATVVMLVISLLLIPHPLCSLWVTFAIASVIVGVAGFMALWDVNLDSISMINLVICIGFSVDFSAHISYAFVSSEKRTANEKAIDAIYNLGYPIIQGAVSTLAGVVVLSAAKSYIFRTFFKIMFLVISFGAIHGIMFIPIFLTLFECCSGSSRVRDGKDQTGNGQNLRNNLSQNFAFPMSGKSQNQSRSNYSSDPDCP